MLKLCVFVFDCVGQSIQDGDLNFESSRLHILDRMSHGIIHFTICRSDLTPLSNAFISTFRWNVSRAELVRVASYFPRGGVRFADQFPRFVQKAIAELHSDNVLRTALGGVFHHRAAEQRSALRSQRKARARRDGLGRFQGHPTFRDFITNRLGVPRFARLLIPQKIERRAIANADIPALVQPAVGQRAERIEGSVWCFRVPPLFTALFKPKVRDLQPQ